VIINDRTTIGDSGRETQRDGDPKRTREYEDEKRERDNREDW
jgi:hypothetical protein